MKEAMRKTQHEMESRLQQRTAELQQQITKRQQAEETLRQTEERFRRLAASIDGVLYSVDVETREFRYLSPAVEKILGYTVEDIHNMGGRTAFLNRVIEKGDFAEQKSRWTRLKTQPAQNTGFADEEWWRCKDGTLKCIEDRWTPVYDGERLITTEGVLFDITERKKADKPSQS